MVSRLNTHLCFSPTRTRAANFSDHRSTETAPRHRNSRVNTQKAPEMVLCITTNSIKQIYKLYIIWPRISIGYMQHSYTFTFFLPLHTVIIIMNWWRVVFNSPTFSKWISLNITGMDKFVFIVSIISAIWVPFRCIPCCCGVRVSSWSFRCFVSPFVYHTAFCFNTTITGYMSFIVVTISDCHCCNIDNHKSNKLDGNEQYVSKNKVWSGTIFCKTFVVVRTTIPVPGCFLIGQSTA